MGKSAGNGKCVLKRTDKKYKCTVKHMQMADSQFAPTRTRAKIIKKGKQSHKKGTKHSVCFTITETHRNTATEQQNCRHRARIILTTKCVKKSQYLIQNQNTQKRHKNAKKHTDVHNANTKQQCCKTKQQQATPEQRKCCQAGIINQVKQNRNLVQKQNIKRHNKASKKAQKGKTTQHICRTMIILNCMQKKV